MAQVASFVYRCALSRGGHVHRLRATDPLPAGHFLLSTAAADDLWAYLQELVTRGLADRQPCGSLSTDCLLLRWPDKGAKADWKNEHRPQHWLFSVKSAAAGRRYHQVGLRAESADVPGYVAPAWLVALRAELGNRQPWWSLHTWLALAGSEHLKPVDVLRAVYTDYDRRLNVPAAPRATPSNTKATALLAAIDASHPGRTRSLGEQLTPPRRDPAGSAEDVAARKRARSDAKAKGLYAQSPDWGSASHVFWHAAHLCERPGCCERSHCAPATPSWNRLHGLTRKELFLKHKADTKNETDA